MAVGVRNYMNMIISPSSFISEILGIPYLCEVNFLILKVNDEKVFAWMALTLWSVMTIFAGETAYLFSYFINDSKDGLHLAYSYDGLNWTPLNGGRSFWLRLSVKIN